MPSPVPMTVAHQRQLEIPRANIDDFRAARAGSAGAEDQQTTYATDSSAVAPATSPLDCVEPHPLVILTKPEVPEVVPGGKDELAASANINIRLHVDRARDRSLRCQCRGTRCQRSQ
jgi:hypothetical protein